MYVGLLCARMYVSFQAARCMTSRRVNQTALWRYIYFVLLLLLLLLLNKSDTQTYGKAGWTTQNIQVLKCYCGIHCVPKLRQLWRVIAPEFHGRILINFGSELEKFLKSRAHVPILPNLHFYGFIVSVTTEADRNNAILTSRRARLKVEPNSTGRYFNVHGPISLTYFWDLIITLSEAIINSYSSVCVSDTYVICSINEYMYVYLVHPAVL